MQQEPNPAQSHDPERQPEDASRGSRGGKSWSAAILTSCAILALPVGYLVEYYGSPGRTTGSTSFSGPPRDVASLKQDARIDPALEQRLNLSLAYIQANQPDRAILVLDGVIAESRGNAAAWNNRCVAEIMQKSYDSAMADCREALRIAPDFQLAKNNLKWAEDQSRKESSLNDRNKGKVRSSSPNANDYLVQGLNFLHAGQYDRAIDAWQHTLTIDPGSALAANNIGTAYMFKKEPAKALSWFEKALSFDPTLQIAKNNLEWAQSEIAKQSK